MTLHKLLNCMCSLLVAVMYQELSRDVLIATAVFQ